MNKSKMIAAMTIILIFGIAASFSFSGVFAADSPDRRFNVGDILNLTSKRGIAIVAEDGEITRKNASLSMTIEITEIKERGFKFEVKSGAIEIEGKEIGLNEAEGGLKKERFRGAFIIIKGDVNDGEFNLRGISTFRKDRIVTALQGPLAVDDTLYFLRFSVALNGA